ncbi:MAG: serine protease [Cytophagaceae bacterium]|jgi:hypothetical protein|nr:serine protease [Cytophagaceae bacterium]
MEFFENMEPLLKVYWYIAIPVSLIFIVQTVLTFIGIDADIDTDFEIHHDGEGPFQLFSFRNLINFLIGLSWTGIAFYSTINNHLILIAISVVIGMAFVLFFFFIIQQIQRLAEDNSFKIENAVSKTGQVYLTIPARKEGKGKVQVSVNGTVHELSAITEQEKLETGTLIRVIGIFDQHVLVVEKI